MLESLKNKPFALEELPAPVRKPVGPDTPKPLKLMAAKGALPIAPDMLLYVWYQLSFEPDAEITAAVKETVNTFDDDLIIDLAQRDQPECILDWLAKTSTNPAVIEKIVLNNKTHDATIMDVASTAPREIVEIIANNHVRVLRSPEIIEKIYLNPNTRMALIERLVSLAKEHNVDLPNLKSVMETAGVKDDKPGLSDEEFEQVLRVSAQQGTAEAAKAAASTSPHAVKSLEECEAEETAEQKEKRLTKTQLIDRMNAPQRVRLALMGSREDRNILIRDSRRVVYMSVIKSPKMTIAEVESIAASKGMPDEMISYICTRRDWVRYYPIVVSLVNNPKCPLGEAVGFMRQLRLGDLKNLQKSKSVPAQLARQAQMLFKQKQEHK